MIELLCPPLQAGAPALRARTTRPQTPHRRHQLAISSLLQGGLPALRRPFLPPSPFQHHTHLHAPAKTCAPLHKQTHKQTRTCTVQPNSSLSSSASRWSGAPSVMSRNVPPGLSTLAAQRGTHRWRQFACCLPRLVNARNAKASWQPLANSNGKDGAGGADGAAGWSEGRHVCTVHMPGRRGGGGRGAPLVKSRAASAPLVP